MSKSRRSFSAAEILAIINEADQFGVTQTLRKHKLSHSVSRRAKLYTSKHAITSADVLNDRVIPFLEEQQIPILRDAYRP